MTSRRDCETGAHLARVALLIAQELAPTHGSNDEYVENLFLFAPLHDVGKVAIPDSILLEPGPPTRDEFEIMKTHTEKGSRSSTSCCTSSVSSTSRSSTSCATSC